MVSARIRIEEPLASGSSGTVTVIDTASNSVLAHVPVGSGPSRPVVSADGSLVYVPAFNAGRIDVVDAATHSVVATIPLSVDNGAAATLSPDGTQLYVHTAEGLAIVDLATNTVIDTITTLSGASGSGLAIQYSGYSVSALRAAGVSAGTLFNAGVSLSELEAGGYTSEELAGVGGGGAGSGGGGGSGGSSGGSTATAVPALPAWAMLLLTAVLGVLAFRTRQRALARVRFRRATPAALF